MTHLSKQSRRGFLTGLAGLALGIKIAGCSSEKLPEAIKEDPVFRNAYTNPNEYRNMLSETERKDYDSFDPLTLTNQEINEFVSTSGLKFKSRDKFTENEKAVLFQYKNLKKGIGTGRISSY